MHNAYHLNLAIVPPLLKVAAEAPHADAVAQPHLLLLLHLLQLAESACSQLQV